MEEARTLVLQQVSLPAGNRFITNSYINSLLNRAQKHIAVSTELLKATATVSTVASQGEYSLPDQWLKTVSVQYIPSSGTNKRLLWPERFEEYLSYSQDNTTDRPTHFFVDISNRNLILWRKPSNSSDTFRHIYTKIPDVLSDDSDVLIDSDKRLYIYHDDVVDIAVALANAKRNKTNPMAVFAQFANRINQIKREAGDIFKPGTVALKRYGNRYVHRGPTFPDNYGTT